MRVATFNVLADAYMGDGDYRHAPLGLMEPGARTARLAELITGLGADVVGLQEVELPLLETLVATGRWEVAPYLGGVRPCRAAHAP